MSMNGIKNGKVLDAAIGMTLKDILKEQEEDYRTELISTSHALAKELLNKPDGFITATLGEKEYVIDNTQRVANHANIDDTVTHWTLILRDGGSGNIKR